MKVVLRSLLLFVSLLFASMASAMPTIPTTPVIDGVITDAEWHGAQIIDLQVDDEVSNLTLEFGSYGFSTSKLL